MSTQKFVPPIGTLNWVFITGKGKKDLQDNDRFVASLYFKKDSAEHKQVTKALDDFWEAEKPKGAKLKSNGLHIVKDKQGNETDEVSLSFWTGTTYPDGTTKVIKTYNAKGAEVSLKQKKIGNGSRGTISGVMAIYDNGPAARGVTLYLNAIQLTKFVEFTDDAGFAASDDEDGFTGVAEEDNFESVGDDVATPRVAL